MLKKLKPIHLFAIAGLIITFGLLMRSKPQPKAAKSPVSTAAKKPMLLDKPPPTKEATLRQRAQRRVRVFETAGLTGVSRRPPEDRYQLEVRLKRISRPCVIGDLTIIKNDLQLYPSSQEKPLLLSLEIIGYSKVLATKRLSLQDLQQERAIRFDFKVPRVPSPIGLYLCADRRKDEACRQKYISDIGKLGTAQAMQLRSGKSNYRKRDRVFFYNLLVATTDGLFIYDSQKTLQENERNIKSLVGHRNPKIDRWLGRTLGSGFKTIRRIRSLAPRVAPQKLTLTFPDEGHCPGLFQALAR